MKTLNIYRPNSIQSMFNEFDAFESFFNDSIIAPASRLFNKIPSVDIRETEEGYVLDMDLPGLDEKSINVHVDGANLTISTKQENEEKNGDDTGAYILRERKAIAFSRAFKLPENADPEAVSAAFKNGVLSMKIKKRAEAQKRMIQINAA